MKKLTNGKHVSRGRRKLLGPGGTITETRPAAHIVDLIGKYAFGEVRKQ